MNYLASSGQLRASLLRWSLFTVPLVVALGFLSGQAAGSGPGNPWFLDLVKPAIYPPPAAFGIVWSILYVMMGFALAGREDGQSAARAEVYRCGSSYQDSPCPGGRTVNVDDARSPEGQPA